MVPYDCKMSIIRPSRRRLSGWMANDGDNRELNYTETACALELGSAVGPLSDQGTQSTRNGWLAGWLAGDGGRGEGGGVWASTNNTVQGRRAMLPLLICLEYFQLYSTIYTVVSI